MADAVEPAVVAGLKFDSWVPGARVPDVEPVQPRGHDFRPALNRRSVRALDVVAELDPPEDAHCLEDTCLCRARRSCDERCQPCDDAMRYPLAESRYVYVMENRVEINRPALFPPANPCGCLCRRELRDHVQVIYFDSPYMHKVEDATTFWERCINPEHRTVALRRRLPPCCCDSCPGARVLLPVRDVHEAIAVITAAKAHAVEAMEMDLEDYEASSRGGSSSRGSSREGPPASRGSFGSRSGSRMLVPSGSPSRSGSRRVGSPATPSAPRSPATRESNRRTIGSREAGPH